MSSYSNPAVRVENFQVRNPPHTGQPNFWTATRPGCPPGLECLYDVKTLNLKKNCYYSSVEYDVIDQSDRKLFHASEEHNECTKCSSFEEYCISFKLILNDRQQMPIIKLIRESCVNQLTVECPIGLMCGYVTLYEGQNYDILDEKSNQVLKIENPKFLENGSCCSGTNEYKIKTMDDIQIGSINREKSEHSDSTICNMTFPSDLAVKTKITLLGALIYIDHIMYISEQSG